MANIRILDLDCNLIAEIDNFETFTYQRKMYRAGRFTLALNSAVNNAFELQKNRLIMINNDAEKVGIIKEIKYTERQENGVMIKRITATGYELKGIFEQRITFPSPADSHQRWTSFTAVETIMKELVEYQCLDIAGREFANLNIVADAELGTELKFETRYKNLADELEKIGRVTETGYKITLNFSTLKWDFDIINGTDRTAGTANPVLFSTEYNNIESQEYIDSDINIANYAIVAGQGSGVARTIVETGTVLTDVEKYEMFVDARDVDTTDELTARGETKLAENANIISFDCMINENNTFVFEQDYFLGDKVTIINKELGLNINKRIEEVTEYWQSDGKKVQIVFGNTYKSLKRYVDTQNETGID